MLISLICLVLVSGFTAWRIAGKDLLLGAGTAICAFLTLANLAIFTALIFSASKLGLSLIAIGFALALAGITFKIKVPERLTFTRGENTPHPFFPWINYALFTVFVIIALGLTIKFPIIDLSSADTVHHLGIVRNLIKADAVSLDVYSLSVSYPKDVVYFAYAGATYNLIIGYISEAVNIDPLRIFAAFTWTSLLLFLLGAYSFCGNVMARYSGYPMLCSFFVIPCLAVLTVFYPHVPSSYAGYPGLGWAAYPNVFALACVFYLLAVLVRYDGRSSPRIFLVIALAAFAAAGLHSAFTVAAGAFAIGFLIFSLLFRLKSDRSNLRPILLKGVAVGVPVALAIVMKLWALHGINAGDAPNLWEVQNPTWLTIDENGAIFNLKAIAHKRVPLLIASALMLLAGYVYVRRTSSQDLLAALRVFFIVWLLCICATLILFIPVITPFLVDVLSFALMFRMQWFLEVILPVMTICVFIMLMTELALKNKAYIKLIAGLSLGVVSMGVFYSLLHIYAVSMKTMIGFDRVAGVGTYSRLRDVKANREYIEFLETLGANERYFVTSWSYGEGRHKRMEMAFTNAQLVTPPYLLFPYEKTLMEDCALHLAPNKIELDAMLDQCGIDYVISWVWPFPDNAKADARAQQAFLQDPLNRVGAYEPNKTFEIKRPNAQSISVKVYKTQELK